MSQAVAKTDSISAAVEDYAKAIYALQVECDGPVTNNALAERLGVSAASASNMVKKLGGLGLVEHAPYHGVELTPAGRRVALEVLRHHRLPGLDLPQAPRVPGGRGPAEAGGSRERRGRGARAPHLGGARGADRGSARQPHARPTRRPDPDS